MWNPAGDTPEDLTRELARIQRYASGLRELLADAEARTPQQVDGADRNEAVRVRLDQAGLPDRIEASPDWQRRVPPDALGTAVVEAANLAATKRLAIWSKAVNESPWQERVDRLAGDADADLDGPPPTPLSVPTGNPRQGPARSLDDLLDEAIYTFDHLDELVPPDPQSVQGTGTDRSGELTLVLSKQGLMACTADPRWLAEQDGVALTYALTEALTAARAALDRAERATAPASANPLQGLFAEVLGALQQPAPGGAR
jgi:hypothetical protein